MQLFVLTQLYNPKPAFSMLCLWSVKITGGISLFYLLYSFGHKFDLFAKLANVTLNCRQNIENVDLWQNDHFYAVKDA